MTILQFNSLPEYKQMYLIWERAHFLFHYSNTAHKIALFDMDDFYVEIYYDQKQGGIKQIRASDEVEDELIQSLKQF